MPPWCNGIARSASNAEARDCGLPGVLLARSIAWLMQLAHNEKIAVSNTAGPTHVTYCDLHYVTLHKMRNAKCEMPSLLSGIRAGL
jgi:hypothetical protein